MKFLPKDEIDLKSAGHFLGALYCFDFSSVFLCKDEIFSIDVYETHFFNKNID